MSIVDMSMHAPLRHKRDRLWELKDRWSQPPLRKVQDNAVAGQWAAVMVGYDEYEKLRQQATIQATRIWRSHELNQTIWPAIAPAVLGKEPEEMPEVTLTESLSYTPDCGSEDDCDTFYGQPDTGDHQLAQLEDLCEDLSHIYYT
jgi:hypothetical protein